MNDRQRQVRRVLLVEGAANFSVLVAKGTVAVATGSAAVLGDAVHSLADLANNGVALLALHLSSAPPDREHPYGHHKFETLAIFALAILLSVVAIEVALGALRSRGGAIERPDWSLALMLGVLAVNVGLSSWQTRRARQLDSDLLRADARHTFSDVLTTVAVIVGWQLAARGYAWLDTVFALAVAALILYLAFDLFQRAIPILVDEIAMDPGPVAELVRDLEGVLAVRRVRSRSAGTGVSVDVVVAVDADLSTAASHAVADEVERVLRREFSARDVSVHIEPDSSSA
jgi:cation diffusion facilitator family transporter